MRLFSAYRFSFPKTITYMLQQTEYRPKYYLDWLWRCENFSTVSRRGQLDLTIVAKLMLAIATMIFLFTVTTAVIMAIFGVAVSSKGTTVFGVTLFLATPLIVSHLILIPTILGRHLLINPIREHQNAKAQKIFKHHPGLKIAVAGSFGKTTMKELLATVLSQGKQVGYTKGNFNTAVAHYRFATRLTSEEELLIIEYGEYLPGDIAEFNKVVQPDYGVLTGINEAHLENFKTLENTAKNFKSLIDYVSKKKIFVNLDSPKLVEQLGNKHQGYSQDGAMGWKVSDVKISASGTRFRLKKGKQDISVSSGLLGRHNVGPLAFVAALAHKLGLPIEQIEAGLKKTKPFEHRLSPSQREGALIIDDTYNGNIDGVRVGLELLKDLKAKRKIYVTPGLVEQGNKTEEVHLEIGRLAAEVADRVVLMDNSVTEVIKEGLKQAGFTGQVMEIIDPLEFYTQLDRLTAVGDVVLMQNDWTDNYS